jgi:hypothetical protein
MNKEKLRSKNTISFLEKLFKKDKDYGIIYEVEEKELEKRTISNILKSSNATMKSLMKNKKERS